MDILVLGGCGAMGSEATIDLVKTSSADRIVVADIDAAKAAAFCGDLGDPRLAAETVDVTDQAALRAMFERFDFVLNCTSNKFGVGIVEAAIGARRSMLDLGGLANTPKQLALDAQAREAGITVLLGCGATPGVSNIMARRAAAHMDVLEEVHIAFASFRSISLAPGVLHTVLSEFSPATQRFYYEAGEFVEMPPFAGARTLAFPPPVGSLETYYVPHSETFTLPRYFGAGLEKVTVRGSWRPEIMAALRVFNQFKLSEHAPEFLRDHLIKHVPPADDGEYAFYVQVESVGRKGDQRVVVTHDLTHPGKDVWRHTCTAKVTGIPASIGAQLLLSGRAARTGVMGCEECFEPEPFFAELARRDIVVHERVVAERTYRAEAIRVPA
ncbi:MAG: saccharopine dehydrogenase NADP-binding domain-containing protein [Candidatus Sericytochromatia bacterium]|nr:saccharopine dehydrogenase NADP-binding domain-containing protein [Candidatus Tanganyikabacteria bacterium]